jgi:predicted O-methyltransferase YrrM
MSRLFQIKSYINHWLDAVDEHSVHSPYFFDFYNKVIKKYDADDHQFMEYEALRRKLLANPSEITMVDLGARSPHFNQNTRTLSQIAATSLSPETYCRLYHRIVNYVGATQIVELGTSMGITTLYLAKKDNVQVTTFEGNPSLVNVALTHFEYFDKKNIDLVEGNIDTRLSEFLLTPRKIDFVLMDANHRYEPTIRYFTLLSRRMADKGVIVLDDIYYSEEMNRAWLELCKHQLVYGSVDLFRCGLLFFDPALNRQHYTWTF